MNNKYEEYAEILKGKDIRKVSVYKRTGWDDYNDDFYDDITIIIECGAGDIIPMYKIVVYGEGELYKTLKALNIKTVDISDISDWASGEIIYNMSYYTDTETLKPEEEEEED